ncbi:DUF2065 family protein [Vibrio sp. V27_P1S3P104]|uniref:DUF2065 domain-containing protein n=1 Tax=Vibrio TaxID=662 RepID=UPI000C165372|nr:MULTISPECIES: DUF2065 family protein [Vibrio]NAW69635.1 DUF2065 family protein [Vibrio sp. V28_P6S34P95]NAX06173.1 DUF2065 family protein [Vibrio sp. V30_P3S12P165]NAX33098.1 DUF2065 family protein [Vibrio sp. V29_P1S30P107]NAX39041.1 DUF2065 family protein [Vibrio sp. V27_P1S3P104]NAX39925.1 DUF2065 family protein [Vibrio sp. V26_P1S5P106]
MSNLIWVAIGILLVVEGIGPLFVPNGWRHMLIQLTQQSNNQLRRIGGCLVVTGVVIVYVFIRQ